MNRHLTPGCKTAILINGIPASGKSTVGRVLAVRRELINQAMQTFKFEG